MRKESIGVFSPRQMKNDHIVKTMWFFIDLKRQLLAVESKRAIKKPQERSDRGHFSF